jgi:hypothetical protein
MKLVLPVALICLALIAGCSDSKNIMLDKDSALVFDAPHWQEIFPGQEDGQKSMVLFLPYSLALENYNVDSVYFKGYHEPLKSTQMGKNGGNDYLVYRAHIMLEENKVAIVPPFEILEDQALVSYNNRDGERRYFIVENIIKGEAIYMP